MESTGTEGLNMTPKSPSNVTPASDAEVSEAHHSSRVTYTTAGTRYNPSSSQPLQPPARRGRMRWNLQPAASSLELFPRNFVESVQLGSGLGRNQTVQDYAPLQQNNDRAMSPADEAEQANNTTPPVGTPAASTSAMSSKTILDSVPSFVTQEDEQSTDAEDDHQPVAAPDSSRSFATQSLMPSAAVSDLNQPMEVPEIRQPVAAQDISQTVEKAASYLGSDESDTDTDTDDDTDVGVLANMPIKSLQSLASYDNPSRKKAQRVLACRPPPLSRYDTANMTKAPSPPSLGASRWVERRRGRSLSPASPAGKEVMYRGAVVESARFVLPESRRTPNPIFPPHRNERLGQGSSTLRSAAISFEPATSRPSNAGPPRACVAELSQRSNERPSQPPGLGARIPQLPSAGPPQSSNTGLSQLSNDGLSQYLKAGPPQPLRAGPPGQRQHRQPVISFASRDRGLPIEDPRAHGKPAFDNFLAFMQVPLGRNAGSVSVEEAGPCKSSRATDPISTNVGGDVFSTGRLQNAEKQTIDSPLNTENQIRSSPWNDYAPYRRPFQCSKPRYPLRATEDEIRVRNERINNLWYAGTEILYEPADKTAWRTSKYGAVGDGRPVKGKGQKEQTAGGQSSMRGANGSTLKQTWHEADDMKAASTRA